MNVQDQTSCASSGLPDGTVTALRVLRGVILLHFGDQQLGREMIDKIDEVLTDPQRCDIVKLHDWLRAKFDELGSTSSGALNVGYGAISANQTGACLC